MFTLSHIILHFYLKIYIYNTLSIYLSLRNAINYSVEFISKSIEQRILLREVGNLKIPLF